MGGKAPKERRKGVDPDPLSERTRHPEGVSPSESPEGAKGTGEGAKFVDQNRFTEVTPQGEVRKKMGDPREKLKRIQAAKQD